MMILAPALPAEETTNVPARAARSVHLAYSASGCKLFYNELVVEQSEAGSYFMACGWNNGYFGIQELADHRKVILFSVWDAGGNDGSTNPEDRVECLYRAPDIQIKRFSGEGTGGQSIGNFTWTTGETNRFVITADARENRTAYSASIWLSDQRKWKHLATFRVNSTGKLMSGLYSFIEDFRRDGKSALEVRRAKFGNAWVEATGGHWQPLIQARFTASNASWEAKDSINAGTNGSWYFLTTGGDTRRAIPLNSIITAIAPGHPPQELPVPGAD